MGGLEELKLSAAKDSMGDAAAAILSELASNTSRLETEIVAIKVTEIPYCKRVLILAIS